MDELIKLVRKKQSVTQGEALYVLGSSPNYFPRLLEAAIAVSGEDIVHDKDQTTFERRLFIKQE